MTKSKTTAWLGMFLFLATAVGLHAQTWSFTGSMLQERLYLTATLLPNGQF